MGSVNKSVSEALTVTIPRLQRELAAAKEALAAMYALRGGMEKPQEHPATKAAFQKTEMVLYGYTNLK